MDDETDNGQAQILTNWEGVSIHKAMMEKLHEFAIRDIDDDLSRIDDIPLIEQLEIRAFWMRWIDLYFAFHERMQIHQEPARKLELVREVFGDQLGVPSKELTPDLVRRLSWFKNRVAKDFESKFSTAVISANVTSPIEQIFLMQWQYVSMRREHCLVLTPQTQVETNGTSYSIDFVVEHPNHSLRLAIELDGHDFHEKTKEQVSRDKKRERSITAKGYTILRFSGYEVVKNVSAVVDEVLECVSRFI